MKPVNVLVTGVGAPGGVTIIKALRRSSLLVRLITSDMNPYSAGFFGSDVAYLLPSISQPNYLDELISLCKRDSVDIAFIGAEPELRFLIPHFELVEKQTGTRFVISRPDLMNACMDKWETTRLLTDHGFNCPQTALASDEDGVSALISQFGFPLFLKPRFGSGSRDSYLVRTTQELAFFRRYVEDAVVQEWLSEADEEYTVGVFVDSHGLVVGSIVSKRELAAGVTYRAFFDAYPLIADYCERVASVLTPLGPCNFQLRRHRDGFCIFEINPRCSSTTVMRAVMGFNEPEMAIRDLVFHENLERPTIRPGVVLRYWDEAYIDGGESDFLCDAEGKLLLPNATVYPLAVSSPPKTKASAFPTLDPG